MGACAALDCVYELCDADGGRELRKSCYADGVHVDGRGRLKREGGEEVADWERGQLVARQQRVVHGSGGATCAAAAFDAAIRS